MMGVVFYLIAILFDSIFCMIVKSNIRLNWTPQIINICLVIYVVFTMILTAIAIFFQRFSQGKIDYEIEQKKQGKSKVND